MRRVFCLTKKNNCAIIQSINQIRNEEQVMSLDELLIEEIKQIIHNINAIDEQIQEKENLKNLMRQRLEDIVNDKGDLSIEQVGTVKMLPESSSVSFDTKETQKVLDMLLEKGLFELASALSKAKKSNTRKKSLRITKWKEKA